MNDEPACRGDYYPAMEFANYVDRNFPIVTHRDARKWSDRVRPGDVIECELVHQGCPGRWFALVESIEPDDVRPARLPYAAGTPLVRIVLRAIQADRSHPRYRTWETKTTLVLRRKRPPEGAHA